MRNDDRLAQLGGSWFLRGRCGGRRRGGRKLGLKFADTSLQFQKPLVVLFGEIA
jgi:hypothetical protein